MEIGTRVRAASTPDVGEAFHGKLGTVAETVGGWSDGTSYLVRWDHVEKDGEMPNGGLWGVDALEVIDEESLLAEIEALKAEAEQAEADLAQREVDIRLLDQAYQYALSLLRPKMQERVQGYRDAQEEGL